jgi:hypothetical protein
LFGDEVRSLPLVGSDRALLDRGRPREAEAGVGVTTRDSVVAYPHPTGLSAGHPPHKGEG